MRQVNGVYTQTYNRRHHKVGHLFQGRFKAILVDEDAYLLEVCRYVDLNPLRARLVRHPGNWRWSSFAAHTGAAPSPVWLDTAAVHGYLLGRPALTPADRRRAGARYEALVAEGKGVKLWDEALKQQIYLGDQSFIDRMLAKLESAQSTTKEVPQTQRRRPGKPIQHYLDQYSSRDAGLLAAHREGQHSLTAIAAAVGLSVSRVSRLVKRAELASRDK